MASVPKYIPERSKNQKSRFFAHCKKWKRGGGGRSISPENGT